MIDDPHTLALAMINIRLNAKNDEQAAKALAWLHSQAKKSHKEKSDREQKVLDEMEQLVAKSHMDDLTDDQFYRLYAEQFHREWET